MALASHTSVILRDNAPEKRRFWNSVVNLFGRTIGLPSTQINVILSIYQFPDKLLVHAREPGTIVRREYVELTGAQERTATRDLTDQVDENLLGSAEGRGRTTAYRLRDRPDTHPPIIGT